MIRRMDSRRPGMIPSSIRAIAGLVLVGLGLCGPVKAQERPPVSVPDPSPLDRLPPLEDTRKPAVGTTPGPAVARPDLPPLPDESPSAESRPKKDDKVSPASHARFMDPSTLRSILNRRVREGLPSTPIAPEKDWTYQPKDLSQYPVHAETHRKLGNLGHALMYFDAAIRCDCKNVTANLGRASILWDEGNVPDALSTLDWIIRGHQELYQTASRAVCQRSDDDWPSAIDSLQ
jgi:hypothetical protein